MGKLHKHNVDYAGAAAKNLYRFYLQREIDGTGAAYYPTIDFNIAVAELTASEEYANLTNRKDFTVQLPKRVNYTVLKINDRANYTLQGMHTMLSNETYHNIEFFDYKKHDINQFFSSRDIKINWMADLFGLSPVTTNSELAVAASHMIAMEYLLASDMEEIIVFEDDVILNDDFIGILAKCLEDLPPNYDFLADSTMRPDYEELATEDRPINIGSQHICRSYLQNAHTGFMMYSRAGAQKILDLYKEKGAICSIDTLLFWLGRRGDLESYTTFHSNRLLRVKDIYGSMVTNKRS